ncbi:dienelactone hydrolase family protein [Kitasatospora sp. YST-16]|uniref:dienelactone hydrolase family protein n=1 Tax=Kitasatospora sp. YST-16 TaxID=2998080 RepID=UPI0022845C83|nr:dienelactone hydrolase family protein [Kitasatospora sp. YST-16]WAL75820.1 dienelactone hydrolase family protein [Kitasatospora sp. YST-16]
MAADTAAALGVGAALGGGAGRAFVGFSVGDHLGLLAGTRLPLDAVVACYPGWTLEGGTPPADDRPPLAERGAAALAAHGTAVLGLVGADDHVVPPEQWARIGERLTAAGVRTDLVSYPGVPHGFLCDHRPATHRPAESADAFARILAALAAVTVLHPRPPTAPTAPLTAVRRRAGRPSCAGRQAAGDQGSSGVRGLLRTGAFPSPAGPPGR